MTSFLHALERYGHLLPVRRGSPSQSLRIGPTFEYWGPSEIVLPDDFTGGGVSSADNASALAAAVAQAKVAGTTGFQGMPVGLFYGTYLTSAPVVLPRTGLTPTNAVHLTGRHMLTSTLQGTSDFPTNRGLIEWEATTARAWHQRITDLRLSLPNVAGVKAIYQKKNTVGTAVADYTNEWFHFEALGNLLIDCSNRYHEVLIDLEIGTRESMLFNLIGNPSQAGLPTYDSLLLRTPRDRGGTNPDTNEDSIGLGYCDIRSIHSAIRRGGYSRLFEGRIYASVVDVTFCNGGRYQNGASVWLSNSERLSIRNMNGEGQGESAQIRMSHCRHITMQECDLGTPDAPLVIGTWTASHAYALGDQVVPTTLRGTGLAARNAVYTCTTAGTSNSSQPTWPASGTVSDGSVVWTYANQAVGNGAVFEDCHEIKWDGQLVAEGSPVFSNRLVKVATVDSDCTNVTLERFDVREQTLGTSASEFTNSGTNTQISGQALQGAAGSTTRTPYGVGSVVLSGTGTPESNVVAGVSSTYRRVDGGASTSLYIKESGTGSSGWRAV